MANIHILIVDDHKIVRDGIQSLLANDPDIVIVGEAGNGQEAIQQISAPEHKIDLVIMDINMPIMDGIEATQEIKKTNPNIKILALTMVNEQHHIRKMIEVGASGYILKSSSQQELILAIHKIVEGSHYFSEEAAQSILRDMVNPVLSKKASDISMQITDREKDVLRLIVDEFTNQEIAEKLFISVRTVDAHRRNLLQKIGAKNTAGLVKFALENELFK
ncbi:MAG: DNA-binding response regulator [Balneola sp.]|nr:MAG: DNA-binding response regulator [Balneola sp.]